MPTEHRTYKPVTYYSDYTPATQFSRAKVTVRGRLLHDDTAALEFSLYVILDSDTWDFDWWEEHGVLRDDIDPGIDTDEMRRINTLIEDTIVVPVRDLYEQYVGHMLSVIRSNNLALIRA